jgi:hypothetical protein
MRRADFRSIVAMKSARLPGGPLSLRRFVTTNQLLGTYRWTVGGKTGFTNRAGRCLVASASRGGRRLVAVALGSANAFPDVHALFEYGFSKFVRVRLAQRGQPVSTGSGRPATLQAGADADALVRLDQLDQVRLFIPPETTERSGEGAATGPGSTTQGPGASASAGSGGSGAEGSGGSPAQGSAGSAAAGSGSSATAWFMADGRRLVALPLASIPAGGAGPPSTLVPPTTGASGAAAGIGGPSGTTLTAGPPVRPWPVPPGAASPAIDPTLRRDPP